MQALEILFEDEDLIAINKPAGLLSQSTPDPKREHVISVLLKQFSTQSKKSEFFLHHRLDKDTSGVLLLGKSTRANPFLTDIFREHKIQKTYLALTLKKENSMAIPSDNQFQIKNHLAPVRGQNKQLMRMVQVNKGGWSAETHFCLLQNFLNFYLFEAKPITGRTHQIRVHLAGQKMPIAGDNLYGGKSTEVPRLMLHAEKLELTHPITGKALCIQATLPKDFQTILQKLKIKN